MGSITIEGTSISTPFVADLPRVLNKLVYKVHKGPQGEMVFTIDTKSSYFKYARVDTVGATGRRKIENLIILAYPKERVRFIFE